MAAYEEAITATSTEWAPWYVVPADNKHVMQALTVAILVDTIEALDLQLPHRQRQGPGTQRRSAAPARSRTVVTARDAAIRD